MLEYSIRESERLLLQSLCNDHHCIKSSIGINEGNKIHIISGPLKVLESIVKKVNRHKRQALVEMKFMGSVQLVKVVLEIIEKVKVE